MFGNIKGISPSFFTHKINLEAYVKPVAQKQSCWNPGMKEVMKKESVKLLDACIIYLVSDTHWVSPTHVVPNKGGLICSMEKELLVIVFAFDKFRFYLVLSHTTIFTDHSALMYLQAK